MQELITQGADVNYKKQFLTHDEFPLNGAIKGGNLEVIKLLINKGTKIDSEDDDRGLLDEAIYQKHKNIIQYMINNGIYVDKNCHSSLIFSALASRSFEMLKFVVDSLGVCIDSREYLYEETPIFETIQWDLYNEANFLIRKGADVNAQNKKKETPLHYAVSSGKITMINLFLKNGADPTIKDAKGLTPLDYAKKSDNQQIVKLLTRHIK